MWLVTGVHFYFCMCFCSTNYSHFTQIFRTGASLILINLPIKVSSVKPRCSTAVPNYFKKNKPPGQKTSPSCSWWVTLRPQGGTEEQRAPCQVALRGMCRTHKKQEALSERTVSSCDGSYKRLLKENTAEDVQQIKEETQIVTYFTFMCSHLSISLKVITSWLTVEIPKIGCCWATARVCLYLHPCLCSRGIREVASVCFPWLHIALERNKDENYPRTRCQHKHRPDECFLLPQVEEKKSQSSAFFG